MIVKMGHMSNMKLPYCLKVIYAVILLCFCLDVDLTQEVRCTISHLWCQVSGFESFEF